MHFIVQNMIHIYKAVSQGNKCLWMKMSIPALGGEKKMLFAVLGESI